MGKTRTKIMDDSQPKAEEKKTPKKREEDSLVAKLKEELGIEEKETIEVRKSKIVVEDRESKIEKEQIHPQPSTLKKPSSTVHHPPSKKYRSKKYLLASKDLDRSKFYPLPLALDMVKKVSYAKFNDGSGTLEVHINTLHSGIRGLVSLPFASGKKIRILAFPSHTLGTSGKDELEKEGVIFGDDSTIDAILQGLPAGRQGKTDFDILISTPEWMSKLAKVAKILGPKGLMPNPKNGTITENLKKAVETFQEGKTEFKTESKAPVIHLGLGKLNQPNEELEDNIKTLLSTIGKTKIKKVILSPTMGAGVKVDLASI